MAIPSTWSLAWESSRGIALEMPRARTRIYGRLFDVGYIAPKGTTLAAAEAVIPYRTYYSGESGLWGSRRNAAEVRPDLKTGECLVTYRYEPPTLDLWLAENPNHGVLLVDVEGDVEDRVFDTDDKRITGEFDDGFRYRYVLIKGNPKKFVARCALVLHVAVESLTVANLMRLYGKVNHASLPNFGNADAGTLMFLGARATFVIKEDALFLMDYRFAFNPDGWKDAITVQKERRMIKQEERFDKDEASFSPKRYRDVVNWEPESGVGTETRNDVEEGDFSQLDAMVEW